MGKKKNTVEFNPVKEQENKVAEAVVWSTASLNAAVEAIKKGLPLKANPFLNNDIQLLKPNLVFRRTAEEVEDWIRCKNDKVYFANKCFLKTPTGVKRVQMRDYQEGYLNMCNKNPMSIFISCRQSGKSTTTAIDSIQEILFNTDKNGLIVSKSGQAGLDLLSKMKDIYRYLPWHLKAGVQVWNVHQISFDNNSSMVTAAPERNCGLGMSINYLILDEYAWMPLSENDLSQMYQNLIPVVTADPDAKVRICSTQNGFNHFYRLYTGAIKNENEYHPYKVDWWQVPEWSTEKNCWVKRDDAWKQKMIRKIGSTADFEYQYGTAFASSDFCLVGRATLNRLHQREMLFRKLDYDESLSTLLPESLSSCIYIKNDMKLEDLKQLPCVILVDLAEGIGNDSTVFHIFIIDVSDDEVKFVEAAYFKSDSADLETAALALWVMTQTVFTEEMYIVSIELNTYGGLFVNHLIQLNETEYKKEWSWRFYINIRNINPEFDYASIVQYKRRSSPDDAVNGNANTGKMSPGIRWSSSSKPVACMRLKRLLDNDTVMLYDIRCIAELEAFEDKSGKGHYKASYGHDDIIMTCVQIVPLSDSPKFKSFVEELRAKQKMNSFHEASEDSMASLYDMPGVAFPDLLNRHLLQ